MPVNVGSTNKMMGFLRLRDLDVPSVPWERYQPGKTLDDGILWTVRTALVDPSLNDQSLPKRVGVGSEEAAEFAGEQLDRLGDSGMVVIYPFFRAESSGTLRVSSDLAYVEACDGDLWNLVDAGIVDATAILEEGSDWRVRGSLVIDGLVLSGIHRSLGAIRREWRDDLAEGYSVLLEWSLATKVDGDGSPVGGPELVFYEARTVY